MARPLHADSDATKRRILQSATALFAEHGMAGVSVRDIAGAAKVNPALVHHYYGDKEGLYEECIDGVFQELSVMSAIFRTKVKSRMPDEELFADAVRTTYRFAREHRTAVRLLIRDAVSTGSVTDAGKTLLLDMLDYATRAFASRYPLRASELRLPIQSMVFLIARYAAQDETELGHVCETRGEEKFTMVEEHLVRVARALLPVDKKLGGRFS